MPENGLMTAVMEKYLGSVDNFSYSPDCAGFAANDYNAEFKDKTVHPLLMITGCCESKTENIDALTRSQMWDCPEHEELLDGCGYQVVATDMLGAALAPADRAEMLMNYLDALMELFPECEAVYFQSSGKMFTAENIRSHKGMGSGRFIYSAVNVRFFNIQGTNDMMVDTLGMSVLGLPDLQYHFHDFNPDDVVNHAYNMLMYIYDNDCPIKNGDTIDGIVDGNMSRELQWKCHFEEALIQPPRDVIDICMNEFSSGQREY